MSEFFFLSLFYFKLVRRRKKPPHMNMALCVCVCVCISVCNPVVAAVQLQSGQLNLWEPERSFPADCVTVRWPGHKLLLQRCVTSPNVTSNCAAAKIVGSDNRGQPVTNPTSKISTGPHSSSENIPSLATGSSSATHWRQFHLWTFLTHRLTPEEIPRTASVILYLESNTFKIEILKS